MPRAVSNRRHFLKSLGLLTSFFSLKASAVSEFKVTFDPLSLGIFQGFTNASQTIITVVAHKSRVLSFAVSPQPLMEIQKIDLGYHDFIIYQLRIAGLSLDRTYELSIEEKETDIIETRTFKALDLTNTNPKIALTSCSSHRNAGPQETMCQKLSDQDLDAIFFFGDLVYANSSMDTVFHRVATPPVAYEAYIKTFLEIDLYSWKKLVPIFTVWDDHDTGQNNATSAHPNLKLMANMFRSFYPLDISMKEVTPGPGLGFCLEAFGMQNFFFDGRSCVTNTSYLGEAQMRWFNDLYRSANGPAMLISPQVVLQYTAWGSSFQSLAEAEFNQFVTWLRVHPRPCFFVSGDMHYSQVQEFDVHRIGYKTYEITSSALFSHPSGPSGRRAASQGQLEYFGYANFVVLDRLQFSESTLSFQTTCISEKSDSEFVRNISVNLPTLVKKATA